MQLPKTILVLVLIGKWWKSLFQFSREWTTQTFVPDFKFQETFSLQTSPTKLSQTVWSDKLPLLSSIYTPSKPKRLTLLLSPLWKTSQNGPAKISWAPTTQL
jgi:hypothetical protein